MTTLRMTLCMLVVMAATLHAQTDQKNSRKIRTLPMIKLGGSDPRSKALPHPKPMQPHPPARDPYQWITPPDEATGEPRQWTLASGTNITATLVKFNKLTVVVRQEDDREVHMTRSALVPEGKAMINKLEKEHEARRIEEWTKQQAEKNAE